MHQVDCGLLRHLSYYNLYEGENKNYLKFITLNLRLRQVIVGLFWFDKDRQYWRSPSALGVVVYSDPR